MPPLKLDGFESASAGPEHAVMTKCRVCESTVYAAADMSGKTVNCPDCGSVVTVVATPLPKQVLPGWAKPNDDWREVVRQQDEEDFKLAAPIERPPRDWQLPSGWGLGGTAAGDPVPRRELAPAELDEDGEDILPGVPLERRADQSAVENAPFIGGVRAAQKQTAARERQARPAANKPLQAAAPRAAGGESAATAAPAPLPPGGRVLASRDRTSESPALPDNEENDGPDDDGASEVERFAIKLENLGAFDGSQWKWLAQLIRDRELWIRWGGAVLAIGLACWMNDIVSVALAADGSGTSQAAANMIWIIFPGLLGAAAAMAGAWLALVTGALVFQQSGDRRPRYAQWPGFGLGDWSEAALFWGVGLWLGALPGLLVGTPFLFMSGLQGLMILFAFISACLLSPPLLLSAWYNGSPFKVYARDVVKRFRGSEIHWLRYLPGTVAAAVVFAAGYGILWMPLPGSSLLGAAFAVTGVILLATFSGLYCGLMARRIEREVD